MRTPISYFLILSGVLFSLGTIGVLIRRNALVIFMSVELQLNAVNLSLVAFSRQQGELDGQVLAFFSMVDRRKRLHRAVMETLPAAVPGVARAAIPAASIVELMGLRRAPATATHPRAAAAAAYEDLWREVAVALAPES